MLHPVNWEYNQWLLLWRIYKERKVYPTLAAVVDQPAEDAASSGPSYRADKLSQTELSQASRVYWRAFSSFIKSLQRGGIHE